MPEIKEALLKRRYVPVIIRGVTGDIEINDTGLHFLCRAKYRILRGVALKVSNNYLD